MNRDDLFPSKYIKGSDIPEGQDLAVTIKAVKKEQFQNGQSKGIVYFNELQKGLGLNSTNFNIIARLHGGEDIERTWVGKRISLYSTYVEYKGEQMLGIRVRTSIPAAPENVIRATQNPYDVLSENIKAAYDPATRKMNMSNLSQDALRLVNAWKAGYLNALKAVGNDDEDITIKACMQNWANPNAQTIERTASVLASFAGFWKEGKDTPLTADVAALRDAHPEDVAPEFGHYTQNEIVSALNVQNLAALVDGKTTYREIRNKVFQVYEELSNVPM